MWLRDWVTLRVVTLANLKAPGLVFVCLLVAISAASKAPPYMQSGDVGG